MRIAPRITIYTMPWCHHCTRAKLRLARRGLTFEEVDLTGVHEFRRRLRELTGGMTVPQIVIDGRPIGGAMDLNRLDRLGVLAALMRRDEFPIRSEQRRLFWRREVTIDEMGKTVAVAPWRLAGSEGVALRAYEARPDAVRTHGASCPRPHACFARR